MKEPTLPLEGITDTARNQDVWRLRKGSDGPIYGPVSKEEIRNWAQNSQIAPEDYVDQNDDNWKPAHEYAFLEMDWEVQIDPPHFYGPTTIGAIEEFYREGLIKDETIVKNLKTHTVKTVAELFDKSIPLPDTYSKSHQPTMHYQSERVSNEEPVHARPVASDDAMTGLPIHNPKDQQIRQLEQELRFLKKDYDELLAKYRKLNQQFIEERNKNTRHAESY
ncbi:MAG: GYF domain-containing protein [Methylacidiphilales bacterium]|nr:GYF domain-containing protein [Candidatus Methylacidiphilales bacterium]MDW8349596.1 GYF domain-containing protein [Verrucomicrobiae bacterium]